MAGLNYSGTSGQLTVVGTSASVLLHSYAWNLLDCFPLWMRGPKRGADTLVSEVEGLDANYRYGTAAQFRLPFVVTGEADPTGVAPTCTLAAKLARLATNLAYLDAQLFAPPTDPKGLRDATLVLPGGAGTRTARIHVLGLTPVGKSGDGVTRDFTFDFDIPAGQFA